MNNECDKSDFASLDARNALLSTGMPSASAAAFAERLHVYALASNGPAA
jgi:hypothetical protein